MYNNKWSKMKKLLQINFEFSRFFNLMKHDGTVVLPDIGKV